MRRQLPLTLVLVALPLSAQQMTGGLWTGLSLPVGDLQDKPGLGTNQLLGSHIGGHLDCNLTAHHQVRGHLTYQDFPGSGWGGLTDDRNHYQTLQFGADWVYHFQGPLRGWYSVAGASLNSIKNEWGAATAQGRRIGGSPSQSGKLGVRGGAGYTFTKRVSLEGTLNQIFVDASGSNGFGFDTATWVQVSVVFRFGK